MGIGQIGFVAMTYVPVEEELPPIAHVTITFLGPVAPHWELHKHYGDEKFLDDFWTRVNARLLLLPKHDPQFRRNRERVNRDADRERIVCSWDLGEDDAETLIKEPEFPVETDVEDVEAEPEEVTIVEVLPSDIEIDEDSEVKSDDVSDSIEEESNEEDS